MKNCSWMCREINLNTTIYLLIWILFPRFNLSMVKIRSFEKKNASTSQFLFQLFYYSELLFLPSVLFVLWFFVVVLFFYVFSGNFSYYCFLFSIFFITIFLLKTPRGLFPLWSYIMNKYCTSIASIEAQSHIWAVLMSLDLFSLSIQISYVQQQ